MIIILVSFNISACADSRVILNLASSHDLWSEDYIVYCIVRHLDIYLYLKLQQVKGLLKKFKNAYKLNESSRM